MCRLDVTNDGSLISVNALVTQLESGGICWDIDRVKE